MSFLNDCYFNTYKKRYAVTAICILLMFSIIAGYIEGEMAHSLWNYNNLHDFRILSQKIHYMLLKNELIKELPIIFFSFVISIFIRGNLIKRLANFILIFSTWKIAYFTTMLIIDYKYFFSYMHRIFTAIPVPWIIPVILLIICNLGSILVILTCELYKMVKINLTIKMLIWSNIIIFILSCIIRFFINYYLLIFYSLIYAFEAVSILIIYNMFLIINYSENRRVK